MNRKPKKPEKKVKATLTPKRGGKKKPPPAKAAARKKHRRTNAEWIPLFLKGLSLHGIVRKACKDAGISREHVYNHREDHPDFAAKWEDALAEAIAHLESHAHTRATHGFYDKKRRLNIPPSDSLLKFLLQAHGGEKYRNQSSVKLQGDPNNPVQVKAEVKNDSVDPAALAAFAEDLRRAGLAGVPADGGEKPLDSSNTISQAAAVPAA